MEERVWRSRCPIHRGRAAEIKTQVGVVIDISNPLQVHALVGVRRFRWDRNVTKLAPHQALKLIA